MKLDKLKSAALILVAAASIALIAYNLHTLASGRPGSPKTPSGLRIVEKAR
jgi:hypothetical protein